uniref:Uncharacterized protein n=1 Tax=Panagrolaimus sp. ES5 TaxID=591445 RepID=A0AC34FUH5_9BILA
MASYDEQDSECPTWDTPRQHFFEKDDGDTSNDVLQLLCGALTPNIEKTCEKDEADECSKADDNGSYNISSDSDKQLYEGDKRANAGEKSPTPKQKKSLGKRIRNCFARNPGPATPSSPRYNPHPLVLGGRRILAEGQRFLDFLTDGFFVARDDPHEEELIRETPRVR